MLNLSYPLFVGTPDRELQILMLSIACLQGLRLFEGAIGLSTNIEIRSLSRWSPQKPSAAMSSLAASSHELPTHLRELLQCCQGLQDRFDANIMTNLWENICQCSPMISDVSEWWSSPGSGKKVHVQQSKGAPCKHSERRISMSLRLANCQIIVYSIALST